MFVLSFTLGLGFIKVSNAVPYQRFFYAGWGDPDRSGVEDSTPFLFEICVSVVC